MHKWITFLLTLCASYSMASDHNQTWLQFEAGYRHDTLDWSVQAPARNPLVKVSTRFDNIDIFQIGVRGRANLGCNFYARASFDIGWVLDGDQKDKTSVFFIPNIDFDGVEFDGAFDFKKRNVLDGRFVLDADIAFGYPFYFCDCQASIAPVVGYAFNEQYFIDDEDTGFNFDDGFSRNCCTSKFISKWYGPFIGLDFTYDPCSCWKSYAIFEYHWLGQKTKRHGLSGFDDFDDWNHHYNNSRGWLCDIGVIYDLGSCWSVGLDFVYRDYVAHRHHHLESNEVNGFIDRVFDGSTSSSGDSCSDDFNNDPPEKLKFKTQNKWRSYAISVTLDRGF